MAAIRYRLSANLKFNIKSYLEREFINSGLFMNVASGFYDVTGSRADLLRRVNGNQYEGHFDNWVYETDASGVAGYSPTLASGVYVNGTFHARNSSPYQPAIDYRRGRVFFTGTSIPAAAVVTAPFAAKQIRIDYPDSKAVNLVFSALKDMADFTLNQWPSGVQRQLPLVVVDVQGRISSPYELGGGKKHDTLIVFHILTNNTSDMDQIVDMLTEKSYQKPIRGVDFNIIPQLFTDYGDRAPTYKNYTALQGDIAYRFPTLFVDRTKLVEKGERFGVHMGRVHWNVVTHSSLSP